MLTKHLGVEHMNKLMKELGLEAREGKAGLKLAEGVARQRLKALLRHYVRSTGNASGVKEGEGTRGRIGPGQLPPSSDMRR